MHVAKVGCPLLDVVSLLSAIMPDAICRCSPRISHSPFERLQGRALRLFVMLPHYASGTEFGYEI